MRLIVVDQAGGDPPQSFGEAGEAAGHALAKARRLAKVLGMKLEAGRYQDGILLLGWDNESAETIPLVWLGPGSAPPPEPPGDAWEEADTR